MTSETVPYQKENIEEPGENDVMFGRGGGTNNHSGNIKFRKLCFENKFKYLAASKVDKPKVAQRRCESRMLRGFCLASAAIK